jgi:UPF0755 protein
MSGRFLRGIGLLLGLVFITGCVYIKGNRKPLVRNLAETDRFVYVRTGASWDDFCRELEARQILEDFPLFKRYAELKSLPQHLKPGRYKLDPGMTARDIVNLLRSGSQTPVRVSFHYVRSPQEVAGRVGRKLEADSASIAMLLAGVGERQPGLFTPHPAGVVHPQHIRDVLEHFSSCFPI